MRYPKASIEELQAPRGKFRVIGVDLKTTATANYHVGDFETLSMAEKVAKGKACLGNPVYVYDDKSDLIVRYGSWH
jgi:hypothetical protein